MNKAAHVGTIPCKPPTCHECGYEWHTNYELLKDRAMKGVDHIERLLQLPPESLKEAVRNQLKSLRADLNGGISF